MKQEKRKVVLYIAMSLDGYIAKPNDDLSFLSMVEKEGEDYGYLSFVENVDTVILGRKTYDWVKKEVGVFPHRDKETYVITRSPKESQGNTKFYTQDLKTLINDLKVRQGKNIFIDGGAEVVNLLMKNTLIDEFIISIIPIFLGEGIRLFKAGTFSETSLKLVDSKSFEKGLVQLHYRRV